MPSFLKIRPSIDTVKSTVCYLGSSMNSLNLKEEEMNSNLTVQRGRKNLQAVSVHTVNMERLGHHYFSVSWVLRLYCGPQVHLQCDFGVSNTFLYIINFFLYIITLQLFNQDSPLVLYIYQFVWPSQQRYLKETADSVNQKQKVLFQDPSLNHYSGNPANSHPPHTFMPVGS